MRLASAHPQDSSLRLVMVYQNPTQSVVIKPDATIKILREGKVAVWIKGKYEIVDEGHIRIGERVYALADIRQIKVRHTGVAAIRNGLWITAILGYGAIFATNEDPPGAGLIASMAITGTALLLSIPFWIASWRKWTVGEDWNLKVLLTGLD